MPLAILAASAAFGAIICLISYPQTIVHGPYGPFVRFVVAALAGASILSLAYSLAFQFYFLRRQSDVISG